MKAIKLVLEKEKPNTQAISLYDSNGKRKNASQYSSPWRSLTYRTNLSICIKQHSCLNNNS